MPGNAPPEVANVYPFTEQGNKGKLGYAPCGHFQTDPDGTVHGFAPAYWGELNPKGGGFIGRWWSTDLGLIVDAIATLYSVTVPATVIASVENDAATLICPE